MHELLAGSSANIDWEKIRPVLDEAMHELSEPDRQAILLRFFRNERFADVARRLGTSEDGARMRVERALKKLHTLLAARGITSTTVALAAILSDESVIAAPAGMAASVTIGALADAAAVAGPSGWAAAMSFMSATKSLVTLGVLLAMAVSATFYQHAKADRTRARLELARQSYAARESQLSLVAAQAEAAQRQRVRLENDLRQRQAVAAAARQASQSAREAERAAGEKAAADKYAFNAAALPLLRFDPQSQELRLAKHRWEVNQDYGPLFKEFHFTREQTERFVRLFADWTESRPDRGEPFLLAPYVNKTIGTDEFLSVMRSQFGNDVVERYRELQRTSSPRLTVNTISYRLYYLNEPFTAGQAEGLAQVFAAASPSASWGTGPAFGTIRGLDTLDWNQVLAKAEPLLSPKQMDGMRAVAAQARLNGLLKSVGGK